MPRDRELFKQDLLELLWNNTAIRDALSSQQKLREWIKANYEFCREDAQEWRNAAMQDEALQDYANKFSEAARLCK
jgi:hypothetical protein